MSIENLKQNVSLSFKKTFGTVDVNFNYDYRTGTPPTVISCSIKETNEDKTESIFSAIFYQQGTCNMNSPKRNHILVWADIYTELAAYVEGLFTTNYSDPE